MRSPFPGMNPYLEHPELWSSVHSRLIVAIADALADILSQDYRIEIEKPITAPEEVTERYLEIREVKTGKVITAIEILSPKNKRTSEGKEAYLRKRRRILQTQTHLIEIDLLRINSSFLYHHTPVTDYHILISRSEDRPSADLYNFSVRDRIPDIPIPLRPHEVEPILDLQTILQQIYQRGRYDMPIDYTQSPEPALNEVDQEWSREVINHG